MTRDFDRVRDAYHASIIGLALTASSKAIDNAWRSSSTGSTARSLIGSKPASTRIRFIFTAIAVAAMVQPLLIAMMPRTVAPALPSWGFVLMGLLAAAIASQADAIVTAWPSSRVLRVFVR